MTRNGKTITCRGSFALGEEARPRTLDLLDFRAPRTPLPSRAAVHLRDRRRLAQALRRRRPGAAPADRVKSGGSGPTRTVLMELKRKPAAK